MRNSIRSAQVKRLLELEDHADITLDKILALSESMQPVRLVCGAQESAGRIGGERGGLKGTLQSRGRRRLRHGALHVACGLIHYTHPYTRYTHPYSPHGARPNATRLRALIRYRPLRSPLTPTNLLAGGGRGWETRG